MPWFLLFLFQDKKTLHLHIYQFDFYRLFYWTIGSIDSFAKTLTNSWRWVAIQRVTKPGWFATGRLSRTVWLRDGNRFWLIESVMTLLPQSMDLSLGTVVRSLWRDEWFFTYSIKRRCLFIGPSVVTDFIRRRWEEVSSVGQMRCPHVLHTNSAKKDFLMDLFK